jgi:hypothetical protein
VAETQPRWLPAQDAARHVGMDTEGFRRAVRRGTLPVASYRLGPQSPRWDRVALDRAMGAEDAGDDMGETIHAMASEIQKQAQHRPKAAR